MSSTESNTNERNEAAQNEMLNELLGRIARSGLVGDTSTNTTAPSSSPLQSPSANSGAPPAQSDVFSSLLSNPELLSKLPTIISTVKPLLEGLGTQPSSTPAGSTQSSPHNSGQIPTSLSVPTSRERHNTDADARAALLCAMKPYLSPERQSAIDYILKLSRLGDILKTF